MNELALFAGCGGGLYGSLLLGHDPVCAVEIDRKNREKLFQRQIDGVFPRFPVWDDVRTFEGESWRGNVDIVSGGFPCQDISSAGKGKGIDGEKSGLWKEMARIIGEVRPRYVFVENSRLLVGRGLARVLGDLACMGFDAEWCCLGADDIGAPHIRKRLWILAYSNEHGRKRTDLPLQQGRQNESNPESPGCSETSSYSGGNRLEGQVYVGNGKEANGHVAGSSITGGIIPSCWEGDHPEPGVLGMDDGLADWKHRIFAAGNGQVPAVAAAAWNILINRIEE